MSFADELPDGYVALGAPYRRGHFYVQDAAAADSPDAGRRFCVEWLSSEAVCCETFRCIAARWQGDAGCRPAGAARLVDFQQWPGLIRRVVLLPRGQSLDSWLLTRQAPIKETLETAAALAAHLVEWHRQSRFHHGLNGSTIYRDGDGRLEMLDGICPALRSGHDFLALPVSEVMFLAPEISGLLSRDSGPEADLYSLGVLMYVMLSGRPPLEAGNVSDYFDRQLQSEVPHLRSLGVDVSAPLDDMTARLLRRDPRDRYNTAAGLLHDLHKMLEGACRQTAPQQFAIGRKDIRRTPAEPSFVGRGKELAEIHRSIDQVRCGSARHHLIVGSEPTCRRQLLDEIALAAQSQSLYVFRGSGNSEPSPKPLQALLPVLDSIAAACREDNELAVRIRDQTAEYADALPALEPKLGFLWQDVEPLPQAGVGGGRRAAAALDALFTAFGREDCGAAFLFDAFDTADELTRTVVRSLLLSIRSGRTGNLLVIVAGNNLNSFERSNDSSLLRLGPLTPAAMHAHLESTAGRMRDDIKAAISDASDGNPVLASAILGRLIESGTVTASPHGWVAENLVEALRGDESVASLMEDQLRSLPPKARRLLAIAAVIGQQFDLTVLAHVSGAPFSQVLTAATHGLRTRLLWRDATASTFRFSHQSIHDKLLHSLDSVQRRAHHLAVADHLNRRDPENVFDLAFHYDAAGEAQGAVKNAIPAFRLARRRFSLSVAKDQLEIALRRLSESDARLLEVYCGLGEVHLLAGRYDLAEHFLKLAAGRAVTPLERAKIHQQIGEVAFKRGHFAEAAESYEYALSFTGRRVPSHLPAMIGSLFSQIAIQSLHTLLPSRTVDRENIAGETDRLRLQLLSRLSHVYWFTRNKLWTLSNHLRSLNEAERCGDPELLASLYSEHGPVMSLLGCFRRANRYCRMSLNLRREQGDIWGQGQSYHYHSVVLLAEGRFSEATAAANKAVELLGRTGDFWEMNMARYQAANALYRLGHLEEAVEAASEMFYSGCDIGDLQATGISLDVWARSSPGTLSLDLVAKEAARERSDAQSHAQTQLAHAVCLLYHHQPDRAIEVLQDAIRRCRQAGHMNTYISPCYAWLVTAMRRRIEVSDGREFPLLVRRIRAARVASRQALRLSRTFRADRAHCLREAGLLAWITGDVKRAAAMLRRSITQAGRLQQLAEEHESLRTLKHLHDRERARLGALPEPLLLRLRSLTEHYGNAVEGDAGDGLTAANLSVADRFVTLLQSGRQVARALSTESVYDEASEAARRLLRGRNVDVLAVHLEAGELTVTSRGKHDTDMHSQRRMLDNRELIRTAVTEQRSVSRSFDSRSHLQEVGSAIAAPIICRGEVNAVILVTHDALSGLFGKDELRIADFVATIAGAALENADGFLRLQQMNDTLELRVLERTKAAEERARELAAGNEQLRQIEEQLRTAIVEANAASEAKSRFLATMSHEIRTPLNGILGMSRLARQALGGLPQAGYLDVVEESGHSLLTLINDLLDFSKLEAGRMEIERIEFDVRRLVHEATKLMAASAWQKGIELVCEITPAVPRSICGDPARLRQVVLNLLGNAVKFTDSGFVLISADVATAREGKPAELVISVRDSGIGIPADKQARVFESFCQADSTTTRRFGGTGLGLAICRELITLMGGSIGLSSEDGVGSTFTIQLPLDAVACVEASPPRLGEKLLVAVAEPNPVAREVLCRTLESAGAVVSVTDAAAGDFSPSPLWDVIVLSGDNTDAVRRCRQIDLPVVRLTALAEAGDGDTGVRRLRKPATAEDLIAACAAAAKGKADAASAEAARDEATAEFLPTTAERTFHHTAEAGPQADVNGETRGKILVAEDGWINREVIVGILKSKGFEVVTANDGVEAVRMSEQQTFDLCFMDVDMPNMDGMEATRRIRAAGLGHPARLPIIAMTAHCSDRIKEQCASAGMDAYLSKPIHPEALFRIIEESLCAASGGQ